MDKKETIKTYLVYWSLSKYGTQRVKAHNKEEAKEIANTDFDEDNLDLSPALEGWVIEGIDKD